MDEVREKREKTLNELHEIEAQYTKEKNMKDARIEAEHREKTLMLKWKSAAIVVQRYARGFLVRNRIKKEKENKKKKGKGGKKDKKKGKKK